TVAPASGAITIIVPASRRPSTTCIGSRTKGPQPRARQVRRRNRTGRPDRSRGHAPRGTPPPRPRRGGPIRFAPIPPVMSTPPASRTILVVDDEPRIVELARDYL